MLQQSGKYLYVPYRKEALSIDSKICDLELVINTALSMKRIPVIKEFEDSTARGFAQDTVIDWKRYIDLSKTRIFQVESGQITEELPMGTLQYIYERDFDFHSYPKNQIRHIKEAQLYDKENEQYPIICLSEIKHTAELQEKVSKFNGDSGCINETHNTSFLVVLSLSQAVDDLTDTILSYFGTKRVEMELLSKVLYSNFRFEHTGIFLHRDKLNHYACLRVQCETDVGMFARLKSECTRVLKMEEVIRKVRRRWGRKLPFYIVSDKAHFHYFDLMKIKSEVYGYTDFRELKEGCIRHDSIDYDLLYLIENNIMKYALVKVFPGEANKFVFEGPWNWQGGSDRSLRQKIDARIKNYIGRLPKL